MTTPCTAPSTIRLTEVTARSSAAAAVTVTGPYTESPFDGLVIAAVGAVVSGPCTVTVAVVAERLPPSSIARTQ